jgi:hypothetical protein
MIETPSVQMRQALNQLAGKKIREFRLDIQDHIQVSYLYLRTVSE